APAARRGIFERANEVHQFGVQPAGWLFPLRPLPKQLSLSPHIALAHRSPSLRPRLDVAACREGWIAIATKKRARFCAFFPNCSAPEAGVVSRRCATPQGPRLARSK